ncbi:hypothetical protein [Alkaliphilus serpentinus]|uniref:hypothetical protein n=1 Tax=Alkaliphilus serpentinus TaxID=1482731 RepID=UPI00125E0D01|nr:hypothetical protein [Alkaliphilus serpentinus]
MKEKLPEMFDTIPGVYVEVEMYENPNKPSVYTSGSIDGSIKPKIKVNNFVLKGMDLSDKIFLCVH